MTDRKVIPDNERCIVWVSEPPYYLHKHRCERRGGHGVEGRYCWQHAKHPEREAK